MCSTNCSHRVARMSDHDIAIPNSRRRKARKRQHLFTVNLLLDFLAVLGLEGKPTKPITWVLVRKVVPALAPVVKGTLEEEASPRPRVVTTAPAKGKEKEARKDPEGVVNPPVAGGSAVQQELERHCLDTSVADVKWLGAQVRHWAEMRDSSQKPHVVARAQAELVRFRSIKSELEATISHARRGGGVKFVGIEHAISTYEAWRESQERPIVIGGKTLTNPSGVADWIKSGGFDRLGSRRPRLEMIPDKASGSSSLPKKGRQRRR